MIDEDKLINSLEKANATFSRLIKLANEKFAETDKRIGVLEEENKALKQAVSHLGNQINELEGIVRRDKEMP